MTSVSSISCKDERIETYSGTGYNGTGLRDVINVTRRNDGLYDITPTINYTDTNVVRITDPGGWGFNGTTGVVQAGFYSLPNIKDDLKALRASLSGDFADLGVIHGWEVGGNYSRRKKDTDFESYFYCPKGGDGTCRPATTPTSIAVPGSVVLDKQIDLNFIGIPNLLTLNPRGVLDLLQPVFDNRPASLARVWQVTENVSTGYAKLVIDGLAGGKNLKGAIGLQVIHTKQSSTGRLSGLNGGAVTISDVSDSNSYTDFLPSATMSVELIPNGFIKMGASQTMVRPRLDQERISQEVNITPGNVGRGPLQNSPF
ncbi:MAG: TonB-dependent receptor, partial [Alphaproteobacteria bacterium]